MFYFIQLLFFVSLLPLKILGGRTSSASMDQPPLMLSDDEYDLRLSYQLEIGEEFISYF